MKKVLTVILISLIVVSCAYVQEIEKDKHEDYPHDKPIPIIDEFPPAIQRLDSIKALYNSQITHEEHPNGGMYWKYPEVSTDFIEAYISAYISSRLYYYDFHPKGLFWKYFSVASPLGLHIAHIFEAMPDPWKFLYQSKGVVLAEIIKNKPMPRGGTNWEHKIPYVMKVRIIDDILDSYDEDTLFIRHNSTTLEAYNADENTRLLFSFKSRSSINQGDSIKQIYIIEGFDSFMYVDKDSIIHDPSHVLEIEGMKYIDYRNGLLEFAKEHDIKR